MCIKAGERDFTKRRKQQARSVYASPVAIKCLGYDLLCVVDTLVYTKESARNCRLRLRYPRESEPDCILPES